MTAITRPLATQRPARTSTRLLARPVLLLVAILLAVIFMVPFVWTVSTSLKQVSELYDFPPSFVPEIPQWGNYARVWTRVPFGQWVMNTLIISIGATLGTVVSASLVAYSFARFRYPGRDLFFVVTLSTLMLPVEVTIIPTYLLFNFIGWLDTFAPLIVPSWFGGGAFYIFLMRQFLLSIPRDLDEAAKLDGANSLQILGYVLLPLAMPALTTMAVIAFIAHWNEFLGPLIYLNSPDKFPLSVGLRYFQNRGNETEPMEHLLMAAAVMITMPCLMLFFVAQRYFVQGVVMSGIKG